MTSTLSAVKVLVFATVVLLVLVAVVQWRASAREQEMRAEYALTGEIVEVEGTKIHAHVTGSGPDLVLIHGASGSLRDFTYELVPRLAERFRVIALDRPGLGWSGRPPGYGGAWNPRGESPELQARLLQGVADHYGVERPIVLGHSYGGAVALAWALARPEETAALVLLAAASNPWPGSLGLLYKINASALGGALAVPMITAFAPRATIRDAVREIFAPQSVPDGYLDHFGPMRTLERNSLRANAQQVNSLRPHIVEMVVRYPGLPMPVEILHGTADTIVPMHIHSEPLADQIPGAQLTRLEGVGHMPQHADAEAVIAAIDRAAARARLR